MRFKCKSVQLLRNITAASVTVVPVKKPTPFLQRTQNSALGRILVLKMTQKDEYWKCTGSQNDTFAVNMLYFLLEKDVLLQHIGVGILLEQLYMTPLSLDLCFLSGIYSCSRGKPTPIFLNIRLLQVENITYWGQIRLVATLSRKIIITYFSYTSFGDILHHFEDWNEDFKDICVFCGKGVGIPLEQL